MQHGRIFIGLGVLCVAWACGGGSPAGNDGGTDASNGTDGTTPPTDGSNPMDSPQTADSNPTSDGGDLDGFPSSAIMYQDISGAAIDSEWATIEPALASSGWGGNFQLDPSFAVLHAADSVARRTFTQPSDATPDCDTAPTPIPAGGNIEGYPDYHCATSGDDCHLLVYQGARLYEMYQADITGGKSTGGTFTGSCLVVWDLTHDYWTATTPYSRGDGCNGADAGDFPIAPILLQKAEIAAHSINHALRLTISNSRIRKDVYVHPDTHIGGPTGGATTMPYGSRLRLNKNYDLTKLPNAEAQAVGAALKKYGMFLADGSGGNIYVSATTDITDVIDTHDLAALLPSDFEMVDGGTRYVWANQTCARTVISN